MGSSAKFVFDIDGTNSFSLTFGATAATTGLNISGISAITSAIGSIAAASAKMNAASAALDQISSYLQNVAAAQDAAYSAITDADMATEMTRYVKSNVLSQAAQAMVSQANQSMASVLTLLQ